MKTKRDGGGFFEKLIAERACHACGNFLSPHFHNLTRHRFTFSLYCIYFLLLCGCCCCYCCEQEKLGKVLSVNLRRIKKERKRNGSEELIWGESFGWNLRVDF